MKFTVNHRIDAESIGKTTAPQRVEQGWNPILKRPREVGVFLPGDVIEADLKDVQHLLSRKHGGFLKSGEGSLTPIGVKDVAVVLPGSDVDLNALTPQGLVAHAYEFHRMVLSADDREFRLAVQQVEERRQMEAAVYA